MKSKKNIQRLNKGNRALRRKLATIDSKASKYKMGVALNVYCLHFKPEIPIALKGRKQIVKYLLDNNEFNGYTTKPPKKRIYKDYYAFLSSRVWLSIRKRIFKRDNYECVHCKQPATQVHHKEYVYPYGTESDDILESVCKTCHEIIHNLFEPNVPEL